MKQIIIFLLIVMVGIMGYNMYSKYQRFNPPNYQYSVPESIDSNHPNKALLLDYHEAVKALDGYVITQWSANNIDVRNPKKDNEETLAAVAEYTKKLANVSYFESQLATSEIQQEEPELPSATEERKMLIAELFRSASDGPRIGERSALVYELQGILISKGDSIRHDGLFRTETFNALKSFEAKNGLFPDGKLDVLTMKFLLE